MHYRFLVLLCLLIPIGASANDEMLTTFIIGQQVATVKAANVRQTAAGTLLGSQPAGAVGTVAGGPTSGNFGGTAYVWWDVKFVTGTGGWVAADNLAASGSTVPPPPPSSLLNSDNKWLAGQSVRPVQLVYAATVTPDAARTNDYLLTATGNFTLANPINLSAGQVLTFWIAQDAVGGRTIKWGPAYQAAGGSGTMVLSTEANALDMVACQSNTTQTLTCAIQNGVR
ncbi:MAG TPA: hypothetical protein VIO57_10305 [Chloroflexota bacterium]|jgi:hypothetical protein